MGCSWVNKTIGEGFKALPIVPITVTSGQPEGSVTCQLHAELVNGHGYRFLIQSSWVELTTGAMPVSGSLSVVSNKIINSFNLFHGLFMGERNGKSGALKNGRLLLFF